ncbi:MAG: tetratricopeptide repeat protein [Geminicoccaceae bacterium]
MTETRLSDRWGNPITANSADAVDAFDSTMMAYLDLRRDTGDHLKAALQAEPDMPLALIAKGYFTLLFGTDALRDKARTIYATAQQAIAYRQAGERERRHLAALEAWLRDDLDRARLLWDSLIAAFPRDVLAVRIAHLHHFYSGDSDAMRRSLAPAIGHWHEDLPGYGNILGCWAFAHEEVGLYDIADRTGREAVERNPCDIWAAHAVAHVLEMNDRQDEGIAWIEGLQAHWTEANNFSHHVDWHEALFRLELRDHDAVLALYDAHIEAPDSNEYLDLCNAASLLYRIEEDGGDVGDRWQRLLERARLRAYDHGHAFTSAHTMLTLTRAGVLDEARAMQADLEAFAASDPGRQAWMLSTIGDDLARALLASAEGRPAEAADLLFAKRDDIRFIGGSHAQRDVFQRFLLRSALEAGQVDRAKILLDERLANRPGNRFAKARYAEVLEGMGEAAAAAQARAELRTLLAH